MRNHLKGQMSPYLLQHAENPVDWYPWCEEAFEKAAQEDKPIFLSIGYSTCHWCHVMAHESFEDKEAAEFLNRYFIAVKVDKEERPDIDHVYMSACQAFTGGGGWPISIFMTPEKKPFFAGTYFPKTTRYGAIGFMDLLCTVHKRWEMDREKLAESAAEITAQLGQITAGERDADEKLIDEAVEWYKQNFDSEYGGFGSAPKFPAPHNLLLLMEVYEKNKDRLALEMVEVTLRQMFRGGLFDHIGYGFCRYSTDRYYLAPHFEKMLYDNALLILSYSRGYYITKKDIYKEIAEKTAEYVLRELTSPEGAFYCAQDADSRGVEGKYYVLEPSEVEHLLGNRIGEAFNGYYNITEAGNFEGKSIPNLLQVQTWDNRFLDYLPLLLEYRKSRCSLHLDDKIVTSWNAMMIAALSTLYRVSRNRRYLDAALCADRFLRDNLWDGESLFTAFREGKRGPKGFLDDYAYYGLAMISLYEASLDKSFLMRAEQVCKKAVQSFSDKEAGGFYLSGEENETLIIQPKETYDGAIPSGNSVMAYNFVRLYQITKKEEYEKSAQKQFAFMAKAAGYYPAGHSFFLLALSQFLNPPESIVVVPKEKADLTEIEEKVGLNAVVTILDGPTQEYKLKDDRTTYYVCKNHCCLPPVNEFCELLV